jgi:5-methylcytosine-specific restriction protein A
MRLSGGETYFEVTASPEDVKREKEKARALRKSQWWQRKLAKEVCHYCGRHTPRGELTMDHIVPLARGGRSTRGNLAASCKECNNKKKYLLPVEWQGYLADYLKHDPRKSGNDRTEENER